MNMKRGGSLDNSTYVLAIITILNLIAYVSVKDWKASAILIAAGIATYFLQNCILLFVGILAAALTRSVYIEGLENKETEKKEKEKEKEKEKKVTTDVIDGDNTNIKGATLEGLSQQAGELAERQTNLFEMAKQLAPMMQQAENMMNKLPKGFLENTMKRMKKNKDSM
jgi:hypothetical protein